ncbi:MAG: LamG-like jellyroll fold domain-containing protein [Elusimicrobiota bacterium]
MRSLSLRNWDDRIKSVNYADNWAYSRNIIKYYDYENEGGDCTNFVSQCLRDGGLRFASNQASLVDDKGCVIRTADMPGALQNYHGAIKTTVDYTYLNDERTEQNLIDFVKTTSPSNLREGDVVSFSVPNKQYYHTVIITGKSANGDLLYNAHTDNRCYERLSIHIGGEVKLNNGKSAIRYLDVNKNETYDSGEYPIYVTYFHIPDSPIAKYVEIQQNSQIKYHAYHSYDTDQLIEPISEPVKDGEVTIKVIFDTPMKTDSNQISFSKLPYSAKYFEPAGGTNGWKTINYTNYTWYGKYTIPQNHGSDYDDSNYISIFARGLDNSPIDPDEDLTEYESNSTSPDILHQFKIDTTKPKVQVKEAKGEEKIYYDTSKYSDIKNNLTESTTVCLILSDDPTGSGIAEIEVWKNKDNNSKCIYQETFDDYDYNEFPTITCLVHTITEGQIRVKVWDKAKNLCEYIFTVKDLCPPVVEVRDGTGKIIDCGEVTAYKDVSIAVNDGDYGEGIDKIEVRKDNPDTGEAIPPYPDYTDYGQSHTYSVTNLPDKGFIYIKAWDKEGNVATYDFEVDSIHELETKQPDFMEPGSVLTNIDTINQPGSMKILWWNKIYWPSSFTYCTDVIPVAYNQKPIEKIGDQTRLYYKKGSVGYEDIKDGRPISFHDSPKVVDGQFDGRPLTVEIRVKVVSGKIVLGNDITYHVHYFRDSGIGTHFSLNIFKDYAVFEGSSGEMPRYTYTRFDITPGVEHTYRIVRGSWGNYNGFNGLYVDGVKQSDFWFDVGVANYYKFTLSGENTISETHESYWSYFAYTNGLCSPDQLQSPGQSNGLEGVFISTVIDAGRSDNWDKIMWNGATPSGTSVSLQTRTGNVSTPDDNTWSPWAEYSSVPINTLVDITSPHRRYIQKKVVLTTTSNNISPIVDDIRLEHTPDTVPPQTPENQTVTASNDSVTIDFTIPLDANPAGCIVYASIASHWVKKNTELITTPFFVDENVENGVTYQYAVTAVDYAGNESAFPEALLTATPVAVPPGTVTDLVVTPGVDNIILTWTSPGADGTVGDIRNGRYQIKYSTYLVNGEVPDTNILVLSTNTVCGVAEITPVPVSDKEINYFQIRAIDRANNSSSWSGVVSTSTLFYAESPDSIVNIRYLMAKIGSEPAEVSIVEESTTTTLGTEAVTSATTGGLFVFSHLYNIQPNSAEIIPSGELTFYYTDIGLPSVESELNIYRYHQNVWNKIPMLNINVENNYVKSRISSPGLYALLLSTADTIAPVTDLKLINGRQFYIGQTVYCSSTTQFEFTAYEPTHVVKDLSSGIASIMYRIDNNPGWAVYTAPFEPDENVHKIEYYSVDNAGNYEIVKSTVVYIDTHPPETQCNNIGDWYFDGEKYFGNGWNTTFVFVSTDPVFNGVSSGLCRAEIDIDSAGYVCGITSVSYTDEGQHTVKCISVDNVGNIEPEKVFNILIDTAPPESELFVSSPVIYRYDNVFITSETSFTITSADRGMLPSGVNGIYYITDNYDWWNFYESTFNITGPDGYYGISYFGADNVNNMEDTKGLSVVLDNTPPEVFMFSPTGGERYFQGHDTLKVNYMVIDYDPSPMYYAYLTKLDDGSKRLVVQNDEIDVTNLSTGSWTFTVVAHDWFGHYTSSTTAEFEILTLPTDNEPPVITINSPQGGRYVIGKDNINCNFSVTDNVGISFNKVTAYLSESSSPSYVSVTSFTIISASSLFPGTWTLDITAADYAGNSSSLSSLPFEIVKDTFPPSTYVYISAPKYVSDSNTYVRSDTEFVFTSTDDAVLANDRVGIGVNELIYSIDGHPENTLYELTFSTASGYYETKRNLYELTSYAQEYLSTVTESTHTLVYKARDVNGNMESIKATSFILDNTGPIVHISSPADGAFVRDAIDINVNASDAGCGVKKILVFVNGVFKYESVGSDCSYHWDSSKYQDGVYTIEAFACDQLDNSSSTKIYVAVVNTSPEDHTPPEVSFVITGSSFSVNDSIYISSSTIFKLSALDTGIGLKLMKWRIDENGWSDYLGDYNLPDPGEYSLECIAEDYVCNITTFVKQVIVDVDSPVSSITCSGPWYVSPDDVIWIASQTVFNIIAEDTGNYASGIRYSEYLIDDSTNWIKVSSSDWFKMDSENMVILGTHTIFYHSIDNVDNVEPIKSVVIKYMDTQPPRTTLSFNDPKYESSVMTYITINTTATLSAIDDLVTLGDGLGTGVATTQYRINTDTYLIADWQPYVNPIQAGNLFGGRYNVPDGCVGLWTFDNISGVTVIDDSGNNNDGVIEGQDTAPVLETTPRGKGLVFDGTDDKVVINDSSLLDFTTGISMEIWFKPSLIPPFVYSDLLYKLGHYNIPGYSLFYRIIADNGAPDNVAMFTITPPETSNNSTGVLPDEWNHVVVTWQSVSASGDGYKRIYINGQEKTDARQYYAGPIGTNNSPLYIGYDSIHGSNWYKGVIDDVAVYNRSLTELEITEHYNTNKLIKPGVVTTINYNSIDHAGNVEPVKTTNVALDNRAPVTLVKNITGPNFVVDPQESLPSEWQGVTIDPAVLQDPTSAYYDIATGTLTLLGRALVAGYIFSPNPGHLIPLNIPGKVNNYYVTSQTQIELESLDYPTGAGLVNSGIKSLWWKVKDSTGAEKSSGTEYNTPTVKVSLSSYLSDGEYELSSAGIDNLDNQELPAVLEHLYLDNTAPQTSLVLTGDNFQAVEQTYINTNTQFVLSSNDGATGSGVNAVYYRADNAPPPGTLYTGSFSLGNTIVPVIETVPDACGAWHLDDNQVTDASGQGMTAYIYSTPQSVAGKYGTAYKFDGIDDGVYINSSDSWMQLPNLSFTVSAWINPVTYNCTGARPDGENAYFISSPSHFKFELREDGKIEAWLGAQGFSKLTSNTRVPTGQWTHVAMSYAREAQQFVLYVNGNEEARMTTNFTVQDNDRNMMFGAKCPGQNYYNGALDDVLVCFRALTPEELRTQVIGVNGLNLADGQHEIKYYATDYLSNTSQEAGMTVILDTTPPVTAVSSYDDVWHNADFEIPLVPNDTLSGVKETNWVLIINNQRLGIKTVSKDGQPKITLDGDNISLEYWSIDNLGNEELPHKTLTGIKLDKTPPNIAINSPLPGGHYTWGRDSLNIDFTLADNYDSSPQSTCYLEDEGKLNRIPVTNGQAITDFSQLHPGWWHLTVIAVDWLGNTGSSTATAFFINYDILPPRTVLSYAGPSYNPNGKLYVGRETTFLLSTNDDLRVVGDSAGIGVRETKYEIDGEQYVYSTQFSLTLAGNHMIRYRSIDNEGNEESWQSMEVIVDTTSPVTVHSLNKGPLFYDGTKHWITCDTLYELTAEDTGEPATGIRNSEYRINGSSSWVTYAGPFNPDPEGDNNEVPPNVLCGYVRNDQGNPIPGVEVRAISQDMEHECPPAITNSDGWYYITTDVFDWYEIYYNPPGELGYLSNQTQSYPGNRIDVIMDRILPTGFAGIVYDQLNTPVSGVNIYLYDDAMMDWQYITATDENGAYRIEHSPGYYTYNFIPPDGSSLMSTELGIEIQQNVIQEKNIKLTYTSSVSGVVKDEQNNLISQARVLAESYDFYTETTTDENGMYTIQGLPTSKIFSITAHPPEEILDLSSTTINGIRIYPKQQSTLDIILPLGGTITGTVKDKDNLPLSAIVTFRGVDEWGSIWTNPSDGSYCFHRLRAGTYKIVVSIIIVDPGDEFNDPYEQEKDIATVNNVVVNKGETTTTNIVIGQTNDAGTLTGKLVGPDGQGTAAHLVVSGTEGSVETDISSSGEFTINDILEGTYDLYCEPVSLGKKAVAGIQITSHQTTDIGTIGVTEGGTITGSVKYETGETYTDWSLVELEKIGTQEIGDPMGMGEGSLTYTFENVSAGEYLLVAHLYDNTSLAPDRKTVQVIPGQTTTCDLILSTPGKIAGTIRDIDGYTVAYADIIAHPGDIGAMSDENGHYEIFGLKEGVYELKCTPFYSWALETRIIGGVRVTKGETTIQDFLVGKTGVQAPETSLEVVGGTQTVINGNYYASIDTQFKLVAKDNIGVMFTEYAVDNAPFQEYTVDTLFGLSEGKHIISFHSKNTSGCWETVKSHAVFIDATGPVSRPVVKIDSHEVGLTSPAQVLIGVPVTIIMEDITVNQSAVGAAKIEINVNNSSWHEIENSISFNQPGAYDFKYRAVDLLGNTGAEGSITLYIERKQGLYVAEYRSRDNVGNLEPSKFFVTYLDISPPVCNLDIGQPQYITPDSGIRWITSTTPLTLAVTDGIGCGVAQVIIKVDGNDIIPEGGAVQELYEFTVSSSSDGVHTVEYYAIDHLGNESQHIVLTVYLDNTGPGTATVPVYSDITVNSMIVHASMDDGYGVGIDTVSGYSFVCNVDTYTRAWGDNYITCNNMQENTKYEFQSIARDWLGNQSSSTWTSKYTLLSTPKETDFVVTATTNNQLNLTITPPQNCSLGQTGCEFVNVGGSTVSLVGTYVYTHTSLLGNTEYGYKARYYNGDGVPTEYTEIKSKYTLCDNPISMDMVAVSTSELSLSLPKFQNDTAGQSGYRFVCTSSGTSSDWQVSNNYAATGFAANTPYKYTGYYRNYDGVETSGIECLRYTLSLPPLAASDKPEGTYCSTGSIVFTNLRGFGSGGIEYYGIVWDGNNTHEWVGTEYKWPSGALDYQLTSDGKWYLHLNSFNGDGLSNGTTDYGPYYVDATLPVSELAIGLPRYNEYINTSTLWTITANDPVVNEVASGIKQVQYRLNNGIWQDYTASYNLTGTDGEYTFEYRSVDNAGNTELIKSSTVKLDNIPPVTTAGYDNQWHKQDFAFPLVAVDTYSGVSQSYYCLNAGPVSTGTCVTVTQEHENNTLEYWSVDNLGNTEPHRTLTGIKLDKTSPVVNIQTPLPNAKVSGIVSIVAQVVDNLAIAKLEFYINDKLYYTINNPAVQPVGSVGCTQTCTWDSLCEIDGPAVVMVKAYDKAGNTTASTVNAVLNNHVLAIRNFGVVPKVFNPSLGQQTAIYYELTEPCRSVNVMINGTAIIQNHAQSGGLHKIDWAGKDTAGQCLPNGKYEIVITAESYCPDEPVVEERKPNAVEINCDIPLLNVWDDSPLDRSKGENSVTISYSVLLPSGTATMMNIRVMDSEHNIIWHDKVDGICAGTTYYYIWYGNDISSTAVREGVYRYEMIAGEGTNKTAPATGTIMVVDQNISCVSSNDTMLKLYYPGVPIVTISSTDITTPQVEHALYMLRAYGNQYLESEIYDIQPDGTVFTIPATIIFKYNPDYYGYKMRICKFNVQANSWEEIPHQYVDITNHQIVAEIMSLSLYAILTCYDDDPPQVIGSYCMPTIFSPNNDGITDTVTINYTLSDNYSAYIPKLSISIYDSSDNLIRTLADNVKRELGTNTELWDGKDNSGAVVPTGIYTYIITAVDKSGNVSQPQTGIIKIDLTPPVSVAVPGTPSYTSGTRVFVTSTTLVSITAEDTVVNNVASGVKETWYTITNSTEYAKYETPLSFTTEGEVVLRYYSIDNVGNVETLKSGNITVDTTPPVTQAGYSGTAIYTLLGQTVIGTDVEVVLTSTDTLSGVATTYYSIDSNAYERYTTNISLPEGTHTIKWYSIDNVTIPEPVNQRTITVLNFTTTALTCSGNVKLNGSSGVTGTVRTGNELTLTGTSAVAGDVTARSVNQVGKNTSITGTVTLSTVPVNTTTLNLAAVYPVIQQTNDNANLGLTAKGLNPVDKTGTLVITTGDKLTLTSGTYFFTGIKLTGTAILEIGNTSGNVGIFVAGKVAVDTTAKLNPGNTSAAVVLYCYDPDGKSNKLSVNGTSSITGTIYAPQYDISLDGESVITGNICAATVVLNGKSKVVLPIVSQPSANASISGNNMSVASLEAEIANINFKPNEKLITPNHDGRNDTAVFGGLFRYLNIRLAQGREETVDVTICDLSGRVVRRISNPSGWDGTDDNGTPVANGVYIYQFRANGKMVTGSVVVAK